MSEEPRLEKLQRLVELGHDPYLNEAHAITHLPDDIREQYAELEGETVSLAGRVTALRMMGKAAFADLTLGGQRMQVYVKKDDVGEDLWNVFELVDLGGWPLCRVRILCIRHCRHRCERSTRRVPP